MKLILGSRSIGRQKVLKRYGYEFGLAFADINEKAIRTEDLNTLPLLLAEEKFKNLIDRLDKNCTLITADQIVIHEGKLREKPENKKQAREYLKSYPGTSRTITSVVITNLMSGKKAEGTDTAYVTFKKFPDGIIDQLLKEGNILNAAGGFIIDDPLIMPFVKKIEGEIESVIGLPLQLTEKLLVKVGFKK